jgi:hypothetical protein
MQLYGQSGYVFCKDATRVTAQKTGEREPTDFTASPLAENQNDAFSYFANVIRGKFKPQPFDLSALPNNEMVVKILEAAKVSVETGRKVVWKEYYQ